MLYLHGLCYFTVRFLIFWGPEFIKEVGVWLIFVLERFIPDQSEFFKLTTQGCN